MQVLAGSFRTGDLKVSPSLFSKLDLFLKFHSSRLCLRSSRSFEFSLRLVVTCVRIGQKYIHTQNYI